MEVEANASVAIDNSEKSSETISQRKLKKKLRRKERRQIEALERLDMEKEFGPESDVDETALERERMESERNNREWIEREKEFRQELEQKTLDKEQKERERKEAYLKQKLERQKKSMEAQIQHHNTQIQTQIKNNPIIEPNIDDKNNCPFYTKTGSCRFAERCGRTHPYPTLSQTVLFKNMYDHGVGLGGVAGEDADDDLQVEESEILKHFNEFFEDVLSELKKFGEIVQFRVCRNLVAHLKGNVYVQYKEMESAVAAFEALGGRFYSSKRLMPEYVPVTNWRSAVCGMYNRQQCPKGKECNFLHVFENPNNQFPIYDNPPRDNRDRPRYERDRERDFRDRDYRNDRDYRRDIERERDYRDERDHDRERRRFRERRRSRSRSPERRKRSRSKSAEREPRKK